MTRRRALAFGLLTIVTLSVCLLILGDWLPFLRGPVWLKGEWQWPYALRPMVRWWAALLSAAVMLGAGAWWLGGSGQKRLKTAVGLLALIVSNILLQGGLIYADRQQVVAEAIDRTLSVQTSGYFKTAAEITAMDEVLREYDTAMASFDSEHARTHPPGLVLGSWAVNQSLAHLPGMSKNIAKLVRPLRCTDLWALGSSDAVLAGLGVSTLMAPLAAALTIPLAYLAARRLTDEWGARLSAALVATLPALVLFAPLADQALAFLSTLSVLLLILAQQRESTGLHLAAGVVISLVSFASFGTLAIVIVAAAMLGVRYWQATESRAKVLAWAVALLAGVLSVWSVFWLVWGVTPWALTQTAMDQHYALVTSRRSYGIWLGFNLLDLALFAGTVVVFGFVGATLNGFRKVKRRNLGAGGALTIGLLLLVALLLISGATRGEVGRIWLFFMPLMALSAGLFLAKWTRRRNEALLLIALQLALAVTLGLAWRPVEAVIVRAERPEMGQAPEQSFEHEVAFEGGIKLAGFSVSADQIRAGETVDLTLMWLGDGATTRPYTVFAHMVNSDGELIAQHDGWPVQGSWPSTCWQPGEKVVDAISIAVPHGTTAGAYDIVVGMYDANSGKRLLLLDGRDAYGLTRLEVVADE